MRINQMRRIAVWVVTLVLTAPIVNADQVVLENGDILTGTVTERNDDSVSFEHPVMGEITLNRDQISRIIMDDAVISSPPPPPSEQPEPSQENWLEQMGLFHGWDHKIEVGLDGSSGNSESFNLRAAYQGDYEDDEKAWHTLARYLRNTSDGDTSTNEFLGSIERIWKLPDSRWFFFANGTYEWDEFQNWDHRISGSGGVGYHLIKLGEDSDLFDLKLRGGGGGNQTLGGDDETFTPEALAGLDFKYVISDRQELTLSNTIYPDLGDFGEFRNITGAAWTFLIDSDPRLNLKLGIDNEYQSNPGGDAKHNDLKYYGALVYEF